MRNLFLIILVPFFYTLKSQESNEYKPMCIVDVHFGSNFKTFTKYQVYTASFSSSLSKHILAGIDFTKNQYSFSSFTYEQSNSGEYAYKSKTEYCNSLAFLLGYYALDDNVTFSISAGYSLALNGMSNAFVTNAKVMFNITDCLSISFKGSYFISNYYRDGGVFIGLAYKFHPY